MWPTILSISFEKKILSISFETTKAKAHMVLRPFKLGGKGEI